MQANASVIALNKLNSLRPIKQLFCLNNPNNASKTVSKPKYYVFCRVAQK